MSGNVSCRVPYHAAMSGRRRKATPAATPGQRRRPTTAGGAQSAASRRYNVGSRSKTAAPASSAADAWAKLMIELGPQGNAPELIPALCALLTPAQRDQITDTHLEAIANKCTGGQALRAGVLLELDVADSIALARQSATPLTAVALLPFVRDLLTSDKSKDIEAFVALCNEPSTFAAIQAALPGGLLVHVPALSFGAQLAKCVPLVKWFVHSSSPYMIARVLAKSDAGVQLARVFNAHKLWAWLDTIGPEIAARLWTSDRLKKLLPAVEDARAKARLEKLLGRLPQQPLHSDPPQVVKARTASRKAAKPKLVAAMQASPIDFDQLLSLGRQAYFAPEIGKNPRHRRRVAPQLTADQCLGFTSSFWCPTPARFDWLIASRGVTPAHVAYLLGGADYVALGDIVGSRRRVSKLKAIVGGATSFVTLLGANRAEVHAAVYRNPVARAWVAASKQPRDLLYLVAGGGDVDSARRACRALAGAGVGYRWIYELSPSAADPLALRRLAVALPNKAAAAHVRSALLGDTAPHSQNQTVIKPEQPSAEVFDSPLAAIRRTLRERDSAHSLAAMVAELPKNERASLVGDTALLRRVVTAEPHNGGEVARLLGVSLPLLLSLATPAVLRLMGRNELIAFARDSAPKDQLAVASDRARCRTLADTVLYSPFQVLPALAKPTALATALNANPALLTWIDTRVWGPEAIERLGATANVGRATAAAAVSTGRFVDLLSVELLTAAQRRALQCVRRFVPAGDLADDIDSALQGELATSDDRAAKVMGRAAHKPLTGALRSLMSRGIAAPEQLQVVCGRASLAEVEGLLAPDQRDVLRRLRSKITSVSPLTVFPQLARRPLATLLKSDVAAQWLLETEVASTILLRVAATPRDLTAFAKLLDRNAPGVSSWMVSFGSGYGLTRDHEIALRSLFFAVKSDTVAEALFRRRFGTRTTGQWSRANLSVLWITLERLPDEQVEGALQVSILRKNPDSNAPSTWQASTGTVSITPEVAADSVKTTPWQTKPQLAATLGVTEAEIDRRVSRGTVKTKTVDGQARYQATQHHDADFSRTVLHEIGHAVDTYLGNKTELVYGAQADWRQYGPGQIEQWINDMDGWAGALVRPADRKHITAAFLDHLRSDTSIDGPSHRIADLALASHPLRAPRNRRAFAVRRAFRVGGFSHGSPVVRNGRAWIMNHHYQRLYSCKAQLVGALNRPYALFAPAEFFAEAYTQYYQDYDGTPATRSKLGASLPAWIKTWFDHNVHRIGRDPGNAKP